MNMADIQQQLRDACARSGLSVRQVAQRAGLHYASAHGFIVTGKTLSLTNAAKVAELLGLELRPIRRRGKGK